MSRGGPVLLRQGTVQRIAVTAMQRPLWRYLLLALAWLLLWRVSALMEFAPHASLWFPPAGLSFAALLLLGWRAMPVLMLCGVVVTFWVDSMYHTHAGWHELLLSGLLFGTVHCLAYGGGAMLLRRMVRRSTLSSLPAIIIAFLVLGCLSALCAALAGVQSLALTGLLQHAAVPRVWLPWWVGDMAGALVMTPLFIGVLSWGFPQIGTWLGGLDFQLHTGAGNSYLLKLALSVALLSAVLLAAAHFQRREVAFAMFFLIIPQMWIVYTESPFRSALSLAVFSTATALWVAQLGLMEQALVYQFAICVIAASACFGFAVPVLLARNRELVEQAASDALTKASSKTHFFERGERELHDARRYRLPSSLLVLDIDHFKQINDRFGHAVGDQALVRLAMVVRTQLRQSDVFGRFGGDEFMALLPGIGLEQALQTAERLRRLLGETEVAGCRQSLSSSFGVVEVGAAETVMTAFRRADRHLLEAKRSGRDAVGSELGAPARREA